ncbi:unnamed protein product [Rotaria socialis]|uniref:Uncharacterized protein n=1 Tax=Rotaria socialis TaxID=392032 RepID=A0A818J3A7_9BILA|nr:unnamed protein product [Rotaria socialis]
MDLTIVLLWFLAFSVIVLFLGTLNYFLGRTDSDEIICSKQSQSDTANQQQQQQQTNRSGTSNRRRKNARSANKKRQKAAAAAAAAAASKNLNNDNEYKQEKNATLPKNKIEAEAEEEESLTESSAQSTNEEQDEEEEFADPIAIEEALICSTTAFIQEEKESSSPLKQRNKDKTNPMNSKSPSPIATTSTNATNCSLAPQFSLKQGSIVPSKPKANVAPVKQVMSSTNTANTEFNPSSQVNNSKSIENSSSSYNIYSYSEHSPGLPRFQQQQQQQRQEIDTFATQKFRRKKTATQTKTPSILLDSSTRENDVASLASKQKLIKNAHFELPFQSHQHESFDSNGYSSGSDNLSESPSPMLSNNNSSSLSISAESQCSSKRPDIKPTVSTSNILLDKLVSVFDNVSFSSEELGLILKKLTAKQFSNRQDWQHLLSTKAKNDKTIEHIFEEMYHSQAKILAIELQIEKSRVLELTKTNVEMTNTIKHFQQPNENMAPYQQRIVSHQMQLRRLADENARLLHQLHTYSMMPNSINELKQQQNILDEQLRQISNRNSSLEKEISDGERARKHAAEIYKKADAQKQERIEQMIDDLNKYKKIDKDLGTIRQKHKDLKENLDSKLDEVSNERDELEKYGDQLNRKIQQYEPLKIEYEQLIQNEAETSNLDKLQQELNELKAKNDLLRQRHVKIMEQLNKKSHSQQQN